MMRTPVRFCVGKDDFQGVIVRMDVAKIAKRMGLIRGIDASASGTSSFFSSSRNVAVSAGFRALSPWS
jgi:hypothetical protein